MLCSCLARVAPLRITPVAFLATLLLACGPSSAPSEVDREPALNSATAQETPAQPGTEGLPPAVEKVPCDQLMEWIRFRPLSKACTRDTDCVIQRDACCDETAVNVTYSTSCTKTCKEECPQASSVGQRLVQRAVCKQGTCDLEAQVRPTP